MHSDPVASTAALRLPVDVRRFPWIRRLAADYAFAYDSLAPFFAGNPSERVAWDGMIVRAQAHRRRGAEVAAVVAQQQRRRAAPPAAVAAAERLADPRTVAIVTGQQAGLFGGPLFTLLKALTALTLADRIARDHQVPTVAIFWIDAEDHDWEEVSACAVLDAELRRRVVRLPRPPGAGEVPVASVQLDQAIGVVIDELAGVLAPTEFTATLLTWLRNAYRAGAGMADAFGRWLEMVLGDRGLVVYDASDAAAKPLVREVFAREIATPGETARLAATAGNVLVAHGYHEQVTPHDDGLALFHLDGVRQPIRHHGDRFSIGQSTLTAEALTGRALAQPAAFSPNVLLRPIVQDTLFPTICYVAGPNELAYLAQLGAVYEHFGVPMPLFYPRASITLVESAAARFLARYDLPLESLQPDDEAALNRLLEQQLPATVEAALQAASTAITERMTALIEALPALDPTLEGAARSALGRMEHDLRTLHGKVIHAAKRRDDTLRRQFARTRAQAFPDGHPQERAIGFVYFLNKYGPALVDRLAAELPLDMGQHWVVTI